MAILLQVGALLGALLAVEKVLEGIFPNASLLKKIGALLGKVAGIVSPSA